MVARTSIVSQLRRRLPFAGLAAAGARARIGLQFRGDQLALARVTAPADGALRVDRLAWTLAETARRTESVRRLAHSGLLHDARIHLALAPGDYDIHQVQAPNVPADELRDALRWQLRGTLPYAPEDAAIDFVRVPAPAAEGEMPARPALLVVAAPRATVESAVAPFVAAGVEVHAVDVPEFAQRNLAALTPLRDGVAGSVTGSVAWLSFDHDACLLTVQTVAGEMSFARRIHVAGAGGAPAGIETDHTISYLIERIATQVQRSLDVFERQSGQPAVSVLTVGPHRHATAIAQELAQRLSLDAQTFDPTRVLQRAADVPGAESPMWSDGLAALGMALRFDADSSAAQRGGWAAISTMATMATIAAGRQPWTRAA
jgi:MSHA biogenesis protein MshI